MTLEDAVKHFGSGYKLCKALGINKQNYTYWKEIGVIPEKQQYRIERITKGILVAEDYK